MVIIRTEGKTTVFRTIIQPYTRVKNNGLVVLYSACGLSPCQTFFTASIVTKTKQKAEIKQLQTPKTYARVDRRRGPTRPEFTKSDGKRRRTDGKEALSHGVYQLSLLHNNMCDCIYVI